MMLLKPNLDEEARDMELAKFEAFLQKENAVGIDVLVRGNNQALAYPIKGYGLQHNVSLHSWYQAMFLVI